MSKQDHLGGELWTTKDLRIGKGSPFSTRDIAIMLPELGFDKNDEIIKQLGELIFETQRPDGCFKLAPKGTIYPCHTITALRALCYLGYSDDERLEYTYDHLFEIQHDDGGWRCNKVKLGKNDITDHSNPGTTLEALDAFRFTRHFNNDQRLNKAVKFLLDHWETKRPLGPCQFGIGKLFMQTEFPFLRYNLFYYCYVLSFYESAVNDKRFTEAYSSLKEKTAEGKIIVENPNRRLTKLSFCKKNETSEIATLKFNEILENIRQMKNYQL